MTSADVPPVVSIVGRKNSGKTTLLVALAVALERRGYRIATVKHGHHHFEVDEPGRDSWRHFHEGNAEAVLLVGAQTAAFVMRLRDPAPAPDALVRRFYGGTDYDLVLVEGYKHGPFPKIEIFRRSLHDRPVHDPAGDVRAASLLAMVTDDATLAAAVPVIALDAAGRAGAHVEEVADLIERRFLRGGGDAA